MAVLSKQRVEQLLAAALVVGWACADADTSGGSQGASDELLRGLLDSIANDVLVPSYEHFALSAATLGAATAAYSDAVGGADAAQARETAQQAWRDAMQSWQVVELMQLGPAGSSIDRVGGEDLRDEIYSWTATSPCRVDQELLVGEYANADFVGTRLVNAYGLDAVEYLLFRDDPGNDCSTALPINADGEWDALGPDEVTRRRAQYAAAASAAVAEAADRLAAAWSEDGEWTQHLVNAGEAGSPYESLTEGVDEVFAAMFYLDLELKDLKIALPGGLDDCAAEVCLDDLELVWSNASKPAAVANMEGFALMYFGGPNPSAATGFDDLLHDVGASDVEAELTPAVAEASATLAAVEGSFFDALSADPSTLDASHAAIKKITDLLKGKFSMGLALKVPKEGAGDAD